MPVTGVHRSRPWWSVSAREARVHAAALAVGLWIAALIFAFAGPTLRSVAGPLKGGDFVQFFTIGYLAREGRVNELYDPRAYHEAQVALVPESRGDVYPPVYPPQTALLFLPFSFLSYGQAALAWTMVILAGYAAVMVHAWRTSVPHVRDGALVFLAAAAFPPAWQMVVHGQTTIVVMAAVYGGFLAWSRGRHFWAGVVLGAMAIKPQFGLPFAVIVLSSRDWAMLGGAAASVLLQVAAVWMVIGAEALTGFASIVPVWLADPDYLEAQPFQSHSIRALMRGLPAWFATPAWGIASAFILWRTAQVWGGAAPLPVRYGLVLLAAVLVNPHLIVYDAAILALPLLWFADWVESRQVAGEQTRYFAMTYGLFAAFLIPTAALVHVQASVLLSVLMFWFIWRRAGAPALARDETAA